MNWLAKAVPERHGRKVKGFPGRSLFYSGMLLIGVFLGVQLFRALEPGGIPWKELLALRPVEAQFGAAMSALSSSLLLPAVLLLTAFLTGLSPCGVLVVWGIPLFYGLGVGLTEAQLYAAGWKGVLLTLVIVLPRTLLTLAALTRGCGACRHMSGLFVDQLRPSTAHCGGLQQEFKAYCLQFLSALLLVLAAGLVDVLLRLLLSRWL